MFTINDYIDEEILDINVKANSHNNYPNDGKSKTESTLSSLFDH